MSFIRRRRGIESAEQYSDEKNRLNQTSYRIYWYWLATLGIFTVIGYSIGGAVKQNTVIPQMKNITVPSAPDSQLVSGNCPLIQALQKQLKAQQEQIEHLKKLAYSKTDTAKPIQSKRRFTRQVNAPNYSNVF
jgi:hypothetical protein